MPIGIKKKHFSFKFWKRTLWGTPTRKKLSGNFFLLSILQIAKYLLPLITLPYLVRILQPSNYGLVAFAQAFISYFTIFTDYGFNLSATRDISINRENKQIVKKIFSSVFAAKLLLGLLSSVVLLIILFFIPKFHNNWLLYIYSFGIVIGTILFPVWFFQGMEKMKYITILDIAAKIFFTVSIFIFIRKPEDYLYVPLLNSLGYIIVGIVSLVMIYKDFRIKPMIPSLNNIKYQFKEGWYIFASTMAVTSYRVLPSIAIGIFYSYSTVGYYVVGEKLIRTVTALLEPLTRTVFPFLSKSIQESSSKGINIALSILRKLNVVTLCLSGAIFVFAEPIIYYFSGADYMESVLVLKIFSLLPFFVGIANIFGVQIMLNINLKKEFLYILITGGIINLILLGIFIPLTSIYGVAFSVLLTEFFVMLMMVWTVYKNLKKQNFNLIKSMIKLK